MNENSKKKVHYKKILAAVPKWIILGFFLVITIYPVFWMVFGSLKSTSEFYLNIWGLPKTFLFENYINAWSRGQLGMKYINSILTTGLFLLIVIPVNSCAAYALARVRFRGRKLIYSFLLVGMVVILIYSRLFGMNILWHALLPDEGSRAAKNAMEESSELLGYLFVLVSALMLRFGKRR